MGFPLEFEMMMSKFRSFLLAPRASPRGVPPRGVPLGGARRRRTSSRRLIGYISDIHDSYSIYSPIHSARVISDFFESRPRGGPQLGS